MTAAAPDVVDTVPAPREPADDGPAGDAAAPAPGRLRRLLPGRRAVVERGTAAGAAEGVAVLLHLGAQPGLAVRLSGPAVLLGAALVGAGLSAGLAEPSGRGALLAPAGLLLARVALTLRSGRPLLSAVLSRPGVLVLLLAVGASAGWSFLPPAPAVPAPALPVSEVPPNQTGPLQQQLQDLQRRLADIKAPPS